MNHRGPPEYKVRTMETLRNRLLIGIENRARRRAAAFASQLVEGNVENREAVQAGIEFERWLAESCRDVLEA